MKELEKKFQQLLSEVKANNITKNGVTSQQMTELEAKNEDRDENIEILKAAIFYDIQHKAITFTF